MTHVGHIFSERDFTDAAAYSLQLLLRELENCHFGKVGLTYNLLQACAWATKALHTSDDHTADMHRLSSYRKNLLRSWCEPSQSVSLGHIENLEREEKYLAPKVDLRWAETSNSADGRRLQEVRKALEHWRMALESAPSRIVGVV